MTTLDRTRHAFSVDEAAAVLARTPASFNALLRGLPDSWTTAHEGGDTWSPFDIVGHLIHAEQTDWIPRARLILEHGETREFEKFDRLAQFTHSAGRTLPDLLDEFTLRRTESLRALRAFNLDRRRSRSHRPPPGVRRGDAASSCSPPAVRARPRSRDAGGADSRTTIRG